MTAEKTREEWAKKLGISQNDPNLGWHIEQATANELPSKEVKPKPKIVPPGQKLSLHKPQKDARVVVYGQDDD